ncbi:4'-phosphopantetheinyl transferase superfamily protein [Rhizobium sp. R339]|uniref:4'-phosphopantetheinyl transferase family protein n=1 Tax=Rhizobium sp. R339 TaxID=1764273 RepID=UPI001130B690|nr:4'-phosphopantetheinyl transferase superfamily protein [Rhizobium sp. R339]
MLRANSIYWVKPDEDWANLSESMPCLSPAEAAKSKSYRSDLNRRNFVIGRTLLRLLVGQLLGFDATQVEFSIGPNGKPHHVDRFGFEWPFFNVSHTPGLIIIALSTESVIGIDAEHVAGGRYFELYDHVLSVREKIQICALEPSLQPRAFLRVWTRKEALLKAAGFGITQELSEFDVSVGDSSRILPVLRHDGQIYLSQFAVRDVSIVDSHLTSIACSHDASHFEVKALTLAVLGM